MGTWIEFHDSTISAITQDGTCIKISLDAYVHRWDRVEAGWKGTGWMQPVQIFVEDSADVMISGLPVDLDGGELRTVQGTCDNLVPLPFAVSGPVSLRLELMSGEALEIAGRDIAINPAGEARYVEVLPDDFRPTDAG